MNGDRRISSRIPRRVVAASAALAIAAALLPWPCHAQTADAPSLISFQGRLTDTQSNPLGGSHNFVFAVYPAAVGGAALWTETQNAVTVTNGVLSVQLGAATPIPADVFRLDQAYLQITVDGAPLSPRQRLVSAPYALNSRLFKGREFEGLVSTDAAQVVGGQKTFLLQLSVSSDVYLSAGQLNVQGNRLTTPGGLLDAGKLTNALPALDGSALTGISATRVSVGGVDLSTVTAALAAKLSTTAGIAPGLVDLSTVTTALAGKLSAGAAVSPGQVDLSTVTAALAGKLAVGGNAANITGNLSTGQIDLSTVTAALAGKLSSTAGISPGLVDLSTVTAALAGKLSAGAAVSPGQVDLSTVTAALAGKLAVGGNAANITGNLSTSQIDLSTITTALAGKLSAGAAVTPGQVDLSTVTTALAGKLSVGAGLSAGQVDLSTVTTALAGKLSSTAGIAPGLVDLSTVTTALAGKLAVGGNAANITGNLSTGQIDLSTITAALAGKLSAGAAVSPGQVDLSTVTAALAGKLSSTAGIAPGLVDLSTVTTALAGKLAVGGNAANITGNLSTGQIDLSTITAALAGKLAAGAAVSPGQVDLSTVTAALAGKLSSTAGISSGLVDLSTVTTALAGKLSSTAGIAPGLIDLSTVTTALGGKLSSSEGIAPGLIDLSTVASGLIGKLSIAGGGVTGPLTVSGATLTVTGGGMSVAASTFVVVGGRVGIGTSAPAQMLHVNGVMQVEGQGGSPPYNIELRNGVPGIGFQTSSSNGAAILEYRNSGGGQVGNVTYDFSNNRWWVRNGGSIRLLVESAGNVAVGTLSPGAKFDVGGNAQFGSGVLKSTFSAVPSDAEFALSLSSGLDVARGPVRLNSGGFIRFPDGTTQVSAASGGGWTDSGAYVSPADAADAVLIPSTLTVQGPAFSVAGSTFVVQNGRLGIGTADPGTKLHLSSGVLLLDGAGAGARLPDGTAAAPAYSFGSDAGVGLFRPSAGDVALSVTGNGDFAALWPAGGANPSLLLAHNVGPLGTGGGSIHFGRGGGTTMELLGCGRAGTDILACFTANTERFRVDAAGKFGLGTTAPQTLLDVGGSAQFGSGVLKSTFNAVPGTAEYALSLSSGLFVAAGPVVLNTGGFLRFPDGTTQASAAAGGAETNTYASSKTFSDAVAIGGDLRVGGSSASTMTSTGRFLAANGTVGAPAYSFGAEPTSGMFVQPGNPNIEFAAGGQRRFLINTNGQINMPSGSAGTPGLSDITNQNAGLFMGNRFVAVTTDGVERLRATADGDVGLGTGSPEARLHVSSASASASDTLLKVSSGTGAGQELLLVKGDGNVGLGTANPSERLHVERGDAANSYIMLKQTHPDGYGAGFRLRTLDRNWVLAATDNASGVDNSGAFVLQDESQGQVRMVVNSAGYMGVGTVTPAQKLEVEGGAIIAKGFGNRAGGTGSALEMGYDGTKSVLQSYDRTASVYKPTYLSASSFQFDQGNVGIGTANPQSKLEVVGDVQVGGATASTISASGYLTLANLGSAPGTAVPGRMYYDSGLNTLRFSTGATASTWVNISTNPGGVPAGTVAHFNLTACPTGWTELTGARGRYFVGLPSGGTLAGTSGTALTNLESRAVGQHNHGITDPGHIHGLNLLDGANGDGPYIADGVSGSAQRAATTLGGYGIQNAVTDVTINNAGSVAGTNAPYMQLLVCQCTGPEFCQSGGSAHSANAASNLAGGGPGGLPYQSAANVTAFLGIGGSNSVLVSNGSVPSWSTTPTLTGTNFTGIPDGALTSNVALLTGSQSFSGAKTFSAATSFPGSGVWNATGQVGVGTGAPASKFHVLDGDIRVSTGIGQASRGIIFQDGSVQTTAAAGGAETNTFVSSKTFLDAVGVGGNLGVGLNGATSRLQVRSPATSSHVIAVDASDGSALASLYEDSSGNGQLFLRDSAGTSKVFVNASGSSHLLGGNLGLGTENPAAKLHVSSGGLFVDGNTAVPLQVGVSSLVLTVGGNVGMQTSSPGTNLLGSGNGYDLTNTLVHVKSAAGGGGYATLALEGATGSTLDMMDSGASANNKFLRLRMDGGTAKFHSIKDDISGVQTDNILAMDLANGRTGFGTSAPTDRISVIGNVGIDDDLVTSDRGCLRFNGTSDQLEWSNDCSSFQAFAASSGGGWTDDGTLLRLNTNTDSVAIGYTASTAKLTVRSDGDGNAGFPALRLLQSAQTDFGFDIGVDSNVNGNLHIQRVEAGVVADDSLVIARSNGSVGIGVGASGPSAALHVSSAATVATTPVLIVSSGTGVGQELLVVRRDGKVGIGTASPTSTLTVVGAANLTGTVAGPLTSHGGVTLASVLGGAGLHTTSGSGGVIIARQDSNSFGTGVTELVYAAGSNTNSDALNNNDGQTNSVLMFGRAANLRDSGSNKGLVLVSGKADQHCITSGGGVSISGDCGTLYLNHGGGEGKSHLVGDVDSVYSQNNAPGGGYFSGVGRAGTVVGNSGSDNLNAAGSALLVGRATGGITTSAGEFLVVSSQTTGTVTPVGTNSLAVLGNGSRSRIASGYGYEGGSRGANSVVLEFRDFKPLEQLATGNGLTVADGDIRISTTTGTRGIIFQDGSVQTTAASGAGVETNTYASSKTIYGTLLATNSVRATGWTATPGGTGAGVELMYITPNGAGSLLAYDRDASRYKTLDYYGSDHRFYTSQSSNISAILGGNGSLGLGTYPSDASARLHVSSASASASDTLLKVSSGTGAGQEIFVVKGGGNLGIGNTNPSERLHLERADAANSYMLLKNTHADGYGAGFRLQTLDRNWVLAATDNASGVDNSGAFVLQDESQGQVRMVVNSAGFMGVGTVTPAQKLEVEGGAIIAKGFGNRAGGTGSALELGYDGTKSVLQSYDRTGSVYKPAYLSASSFLFDQGPVRLVSTLTVTGAGFSVGGTYFSVVPAGPVGVNKTPTTEYFEVNGAIKAESSAANFVAGNPGMLLDYTGTSARLIQVNGASGSAVPLLLGNGNAELMRIATNGSVGIGTTNPQLKLDVGGDAQFGAGVLKSTFTATPGSSQYALDLSSGLNVARGPVVLNTGGFLRFADGTTQNTAASAGSGVPAGAVMHFNLSSCPSGWTALVAAQGRYLVGLPSGGTLAGTSGTALSNLESRASGTHAHGITDPGHSHTLLYGADGGGGNSAVEAVQEVSGLTTNSAVTGITINNSGAVAGTNAPYIQLLACQKD